jgi:putative transposase
MRKNNRNIVVNQEEVKLLSLEEIVILGIEERVRMALIQERGNFLKAMEHFRMENGNHAIVANGFGKERTILAQTGPVSITNPRVYNRGKVKNEAGEFIEFESQIAPRYIRKSMTVEETIPLLYLHGLSTNDFIPALKKMFGNKAAGLSSSTISRMLQDWKAEMEAWKKRDLSDTEYCYVWVDGIYFGARNSENDLCILVMIGATKEGKKELIMTEIGYRESTESWLSLLRRTKEQGLNTPKLFIGDGALGFWAASRQVFPGVKEQRCWVHKTANILDKLPKTEQPQAKRMLHEIYLCSSKKDALKGFDRFINVYVDKYPKAVDCLTKDKEQLLTFYDFPAAHWQSIRTTNPIESTFATARLRSKKTRGNWSSNMTEGMVYKLLEKASTRWHRLKKHKEIEKVMKGVKYSDGLEQEAA